MKRNTLLFVGIMFMLSGLSRLFPVTFILMLTWVYIVFSVNFYVFAVQKYDLERLFFLPTYAGLMLNAAVCLCNWGQMPVVQKCIISQPSMWINASSRTHFTFLADRLETNLGPGFGPHSMGDDFIFVGAIICILVSLINYFLPLPKLIGFKLVSDYDACMGGGKVMPKDEWKRLWKVMWKSGNWDYLRAHPQHFPKGTWEHVMSRHTRRMRAMGIETFQQFVERRIKEGKSHSLEHYDMRRLK